MAKNKTAGKDGEVNNTRKSPIKGIIGMVATLLIVVIILSAVFGGAFYLIIHNNVNGLAERYRTSIQNIPIARLALPVAPDPLDPKYLTADQIKEKYVEFRQANAELQKQLDDAIAAQKELQKYKDDYDKMVAEYDAKNKALETRTGELDTREAQLNELKASVDELIASGDKEGLAKYFETVNSTTAAAIYEKVKIQQVADENTKKFAQIYAAMDASTAASIFEAMGAGKMELIATTLKAMNKDNSSQIIAAMTPAFAATVTSEIDKLYKSQ
ncbi:MAG: DUF615 domain-containing protein [Clostridiales bacterium]|nr:DUF615 domain-containing protein [Clostridiales bacterium]